MDGFGATQFVAFAADLGIADLLAHRMSMVPWLRPLEPLLRRLSQAQSQRAVQAMKTIVEG